MHVHTYICKNIYDKASLDAPAAACVCVCVNNVRKLTYNLRK